MKMDKPVYKLAFCLVIILAVSSHPFAAEPEEKEQSPVFGELNTQVPGTFSGKLQLLMMRRNFDHEDASSGTLATTLRYLSPEKYPVQLGLSYIHTALLFEGGSLNPPEDGAHRVLNDRFSILQEAYLKIKLDSLGIEDSHFTIGRKNSDYDFAPSFAIRQKPQGLEGLFLHIGQWEDVSIDLGHIERFSSWAGRNEGGDYLHYRYQKIEDVIADHDNIATPDSASNMQFINIEAQPFSILDLTLYDLYGHNLYNTFGVKTALTLDSTETGSLVWNNHYINQTDVGDYDEVLGQGLDANAWESSLQFRHNNFMIEPGIFTVLSEDALRHPMESSLTWEYTLDWFTRPNLGDSNSAFLKSTYTWGDTLFYGLWFVTDHDSDVGNGAFDQEIDFVIKHNFTDNFSAAIKAGYGHQDNRGGDADKDREDMRLFLTYTF